MEYKVEELKYLSADGKTEIYAKIMSPIDSRKVKGIIQFCHGMCEYFSKYEEFFKFMVSNGYVVFGNDYLGHGASTKNLSELGFFGEKNGNLYLIKDIKKLYDIVRERFPYEKYFIMGHSMGSLIARIYASKYKTKISGALFLGTVGPQPLIDSAISLANMIIRRKGGRYRSRVLENTFNNFANLTTGELGSEFSWVTKDKNVLDKMRNDPYQNFIFTACGFKDLFTLVKKANSLEVIKNTDKDLPIIFMSGSKDPVGENSLGAKRCAKLYKSAKIKDVSFKIYENDRHELLNETDKEKVFNDILDWVEIVRFGEE